MRPVLVGAMAIVHRDLTALYAPLDTDAYVSHPRRDVKGFILFN